MISPDLPEAPDHAGLPDDILARIGWDDARQHDYAALIAIAPGLTPARAARVDSSSALVITSQGTGAIALLRRTLDTPAVGDWLALSTSAEGQFVIEAILPRRTALTRARPDRDRERGASQCLAANVDIALIVQAADNLNLRRLEREVAFVRECGIEPAVVLSKADLVADPVEALSQASGVAPGCAAVTVSSVTGDGSGSVRRLLPYGRTGVLIGASGVGKSSLTNRLLGEDVMATSAVRQSDQHGRHTTSARYLHTLPDGGALIDTPGLRAVGLLTGGGVEASFPEIVGLAGGCRFRDCTHTSEPGCAVLSATGDGSLDPGRLANYHKLGREADFLERKTELLARVAHKRRWKQIAKRQRQHEAGEKK